MLRVTKNEIKKKFFYLNYLQRMKSNKFYKHVFFSEVKMIIFFKIDAKKIKKWTYILWMLLGSSFYNCA